jgi:hypothetical protein
VTGPAFGLPDFVFGDRSVIVIVVSTGETSYHAGQQGGEKGEL